MSLIRIIDKLNLVELKRVKLCCPVRPLPQNSVHIKAATVEVLVVDPEVAEGLPVAELQPQLRVAEDHEELVVDHPFVVDLGIGRGRGHLQLEALVLLQRDQQRGLAHDDLVGVEPAVVGRSEDALHGPDHAEQVAPVVDVLVEGGGVARVKGVEQGSARDGLAGELLEVGKQPAFVVEFAFEEGALEEAVETTE